MLLLRLSVVLNQMALAGMERNNAKTISVVRQRLNAYAGRCISVDLQALALQRGNPGLDV